MADAQPDVNELSPEVACVVARVSLLVGEAFLDIIASSGGGLALAPAALFIVRGVVNSKKVAPLLEEELAGRILLDLLVRAGVPTPQKLRAEVKVLVADFVAVIRSSTPSQWRARG